MQARSNGSVPRNGHRPVLVVDDDERFRSFLELLLARAGYEVSQAATGEDALTEAERAEPGAVLLDIALPGISGYEVCRRLRDRFGDGLPIFFMSGEQTGSLDRIAGLMVGADEYLVKPFPPDELIARIRRLLGRNESPDRDRRRNLTGREYEVLDLLAAGLDQRQIAAQLVISPTTVRTHIERILAKLAVHSRGQAVAYAYRTGLVRVTRTEDQAFAGPESAAR